MATEEQMDVSERFKYLRMEKERCEQANPCASWPLLTAGRILPSC